MVFAVNLRMVWHRPRSLLLALIAVAAASAPVGSVAATDDTDTKAGPSLEQSLAQKLPDQPSPQKPPDQPAPQKPAEQPPPTSPPAPATSAEPGPSGDAAGKTLTPDQLYDLGKNLFEQYAPPEIKAEYDFPSKEQWDEFALKLQRTLDSDSPEALVAYEPQARAALSALRVLPGYGDYANWLEERLDLIEAAKQAGRPPAEIMPAPPAPLPVVPPRPAPVAPRRVVMPYYDLWVQRLRGRPLPPDAAELMPKLRAEFSAEGVPPELAWLAEVESSLNPNARSPSGAMGLFQLTQDTAKTLGLSTWLPDERTNPGKSARAAAQMLHKLQARFGDWPLAIAAYNAGEGRVSRALTAKKATTFAEIAPALSVGTRLYVPKVLATIALRTGVPPEKLATPGG
jgi:membrane-bound lytic murein transglycosylase D